jgi:trehalose-phosphatase
MQILNPETSLDTFFSNLKVARTGVLMLDYDGTLAPFRVEREKAEPYPGIRERLEKLGADEKTRLVIISGRDLDTLKKLLKLKTFPELWGCHGAERYSPRDGYRLILPENTRQGLEEIRAWADDSGMSAYLEIKPAGSAFHWRGLADNLIDEIKAKIETKWQHNLEKFGLTFHHFDGGIELKPANINKGTAVGEIIARTDVESAIACLGDDLTDEDAFKILGDRALKILVRDRPRPTAADIRITPPAELIGFLDRWLESSI